MNKWAEVSQGVRDFGPTKRTQDVEGQRPMALTLAMGAMGHANWGWFQWISMDFNGLSNFNRQKGLGVSQAS